MLAVALAFGIGWLQAREEHKRQHTPTAYADAAKKDAERACVGTDPAAVFECVNEKAKTAYQTAHDEQDLSAQQRAASAALASSILSFLALALSGVGVWYVKRTLDATLEAVEDTGRATKAMERQNEIAEDTAKRQLRAYVSVTPKTIGGFYPNAIICVEHEVLNHGQTPAQRINHIFDMAILPRQLPQGFRFPVPTRRVELNSSLFPNIPMKIWHYNSHPLAQSDIDLVATNMTHSFYIWGFLHYEDAFGDNWQTEFYASVGGPDYAQNVTALLAGGNSLPFNWTYADGHNRATKRQPS